MGIQIRPVSIEDYDGIFELWNSTEQSRRALNPIDDTREGIEKYLKRNPTTCFLAYINDEENTEKIVGVILTGHDGRRDDHFEEDGQIISRETIEHSIDSGEAYWIVCEGQNVGGLILKAEGERGNLEILFVSPYVHSKGIGYAAWCEVEKLHPEVKVWETVTPYFEKRNIHLVILIRHR